LEAVIFIGSQGAGRSTVFRGRFFATLTSVNLDVLKTGRREERFLRASTVTRRPFVVGNADPACGGALNEDGSSIATPTS
jgi:hypothetical protein